MAKECYELTSTAGCNRAIASKKIRYITKKRKTVTEERLSTILSTAAERFQGQGVVIITDAAMQWVTRIGTQRRIVHLITTGGEPDAAITTGEGR